MKHCFAILTALVLLSGFAAGCGSEIGSACGSNTECDTRQVCDSASPGGYCTQYDCEPNDCPAEAVCIDFMEEGDLVVSACMRRCDKDSDCRRRNGYVCRKDGPIPFCGLEPTGS